LKSAHLKLLIVVPVFNEETLVYQVLQEVLIVKWPESVREVELVVVDDCSTDQTISNLEKFIENTGTTNIKLIRHEVNLGKGAAVRTGIDSSDSDIVVIQDADLELTPHDLPLMLSTLVDLKIDFVNGSRYMPGVIRPLHSYRRYFFNKIFTYLTSIFINIRLSDVACGYKLFTRKIYNGLKLRENRFGFEAELLIKAARMSKTSIAEVPVHYFPRNKGEGKKIRNLDGIKIFWAILKYGLFRVN
jgi:glycosyltransferase involved in cell wall biosynthesis